MVCRKFAARCLAFLVVAIPLGGGAANSDLSLPRLPRLSLPSLRLPSLPSLALPSLRLPSLGSTWVTPHFRSDGTLVSGHFRSLPNAYFWDNWSSWGSINPYTGERGYELPSLDDYLTRPSYYGYLYRPPAYWLTQRSSSSVSLPSLPSLPALPSLPSLPSVSLPWATNVALPRVTGSWPGAMPSYPSSASGPGPSEGLLEGDEGLPTLDRSHGASDLYETSPDSNLWGVEPDFQYGDGLSF